ncbi:MAG: hypothetical protein RL154_478, partial [Pseudomonadota bacterium]
METLSKENFSKLSEYVYRKCGISLEEDKHFDKVQKKLHQRYLSLKVDNFRRYFFVLRFEDKDGNEFQELVNMLTVNETYFFRENYQFEILVKNILHDIDRVKAKNQPIRILSAPCSSGEEPYSIAIHLLEETKLIEKRDFEIIGIDIDSQIIERAKKGIYNDRSLHAIPPQLVPRYFTKAAGFYTLKSDIRDAISLQVCNVYDKKAISALGKFDVIFSRNMLIYFDDASKYEVAMTFFEMLNPGGYILLGHTEYMSRITPVFEAKKIDQHLVYQKPI